MLIVPRTSWGARAPKSGYSRITPEDGNTIHWEGPTMGEFDHSQCASKVRAIQRFHMDSRGWIDIAYNSVICPHGYVFVARWLGARSGANGTTSGNLYSYAHCYLGGIGDPFTDLAKIALIEVRDLFVGSGGAGIHNKCHRDWKATACPGDEICSWVKSGMPAPDGTVPAPPPPAPLPPSSSLEFNMDYLDLSGVQTGIPSTYVRGRHVDNLQALMIPILAWAGRDWRVLVNANGSPDGIAGSGTAAKLEEVQGILKFLGAYGGSIDRKCGNQTWKAIIEF